MDLFNCFIFLYFLTLHADQLGFTFLGYTIRVNNLIAFLLIVLFMIRFRSHLMTMDKKFALALLCIALSIALSLLFSPYKQRCLLFMCWYIGTLLCYVLLPYFMIKVWDIQKVFAYYCASFVCVGLYALMQLVFSCLNMNDPFAQQRIIQDIVRPNAFAYEPSFYALYMTPFIMMCNFHYLTSPQEPFFCFKKISLQKVVFFNFLFLVSTSTSALFSYGFFFLAFLFTPGLKTYRKKFFQFMLSFSALLGLSYLILPFIMRQFFLKFFTVGFMKHHSFNERWGGVVNAWQVFLEHPFFGVGLGGYPPFLMDAWMREDTKFIVHLPSTLEEITFTNILKVFEPMNVLTEILASLGIVGLCAFCFLIFLLYKRALRQQNLLTFNLLISTVVMLIVLQINQGLFRTYVWVHFSLSFALIEAISSKRILDRHSRNVASELIYNFPQVKNMDDKMFITTQQALDGAHENKSKGDRKNTV